MPNTDVVTLADLRHVLRAAEGVADVVAALRAGGAGTIDGAWGSSAVLACAMLAQETPGTLFVVLAHVGDVEAWLNERKSSSTTQNSPAARLSTGLAIKGPWEASA